MIFAHTLPNAGPCGHCLTAANGCTPSAGCACACALCRNQRRAFAAFLAFYRAGENAARAIETATQLDADRAYADEWRRLLGAS